MLLMLELYHHPGEYILTVNRQVALKYFGCLERYEEMIPDQGCLTGPTLAATHLDRFLFRCGERRGQLSLRIP